VNEEYRIHFGFSKRSKFYPQAVELAALAFHHEIIGEGEDVWHVMSLRENEIELMHRLYLVARKLPRPTVYCADALCLSLAADESRFLGRTPPSFTQTKRVQKALQQIQHVTGKSGSELAKFIKEKYVEPVNRDMLAIFQRLRADGRLDSYDYESLKSIPATHPIPDEPIGAIREIRALVSAGRLHDALAAYYAYLGDKFYGELTSELIYLKRLAGVPLAGRDLLFFRSKSSCDDFLRQHLKEYVQCIDLALAQCEQAGQAQPLNLLLQHAPAMEQMIEARHNDWNFAAYLKDGTVKRGSQPVTIHNFSAQYDACPEGRIFDRYPDQVQHCRESWIEDSEYSGLWMLYSPAFCKEHIYDVGLRINSIDAYLHRSWRRRLNRPRSPDFTSVLSLAELEKATYGTGGIRFTGRTHIIESKTFYEIDLIRRKPVVSSEVENPFIELVEEVFREAENLLRERHGLPRIGEGWVSEMLMFRLIQQRFPDAELRAQPDWLKPQHLDCYVSSMKLGFEFQGQQHFEPVAVFGGEQGLVQTQQRDRLKAKSCRDNGVTLIRWAHHEALNTDVLVAKLAETVGITNQP
jgi:hypothetical protein